MNTHLGDLDDTSAHDDAQAESLGQGILEAIAVGDVQVVYEGLIAVLADDGFRGLAKEEGDVMGDGCELGCERSDATESAAM